MFRLAHELLDFWDIGPTALHRQTAAVGSSSWGFLGFGFSGGAEVDFLFLEDGTGFLGLFGLFGLISFVE